MLVTLNPLYLKIGKTKWIGGGVTLPRKLTPLFAQI